MEEGWLACARAGSRAHAPKPMTEFGTALIDSFIPPDGSNSAVDGVRLPAGIRADALGFAYGRTAADQLDRRVLSGVSLSVAPGELVALVGPNGCGKSTLLRLLAGLLRPTEGSVAIAGQRVDGPDPRVGLVFQGPRLLPWRSTLDNVGFPLELAAWPRDQRESRARELLTLVGLSGVERQRPYELSGGMRQRAAIARALTLDPAVLLLDEPFSALDALTRDRLNLELQELWRATRTTILLVTHSIPEAVFLADRVLVMSPRPGRIVADVSVDLSRPRALDQLDTAAVSEAAAQIRSHLFEEEAA